MLVLLARWHCIGIGVVVASFMLWLLLLVAFLVLPTAFFLLLVLELLMSLLGLFRVYDEVVVWGVLV